MVKFTNKSTKMVERKGDEDVNIGYAKLLMVGVNSVPEKGLTISDMKKCFNIVDILENMELEATVSIDPEDFKFAVEKLPKEWAIMHRDVVAFVEYIEELSK